MTTKQFTRVDCSRGAPMGRHQEGTEPSDGRTVSLFKVRLDAGGYDDGGAYWGSRKPGESIYCARADGYRRFIDARSRNGAADALGLDNDVLLSPRTNERLYWFSSSSGSIELQMTMEQAKGASHSGQCDADVMALSRLPAIAKQLADVDKEALRDELQGYGAWDEAELSDHAQNLQRVLWLAAADISENQS